METIHRNQRQLLQKITGKTVGILVESQYQDLEVWYPALRLREEGVKTFFVGTGSAAQYTGKFGYPLTPDITADKIDPRSLDGLIVPGGWAPDFLRRYPAVLALIKAVSSSAKPLGCICHGAWVLVSANVLQGKTLTCFSAIKDDVINAGGRYVDQEVVTDGSLVTSRKPEDLPAFMKAFLAVLSVSSRTTSVH